MPVKMRENGNFSDAGVERFYSVRINWPKWRCWPGSPLQQPIWNSGGSPICFH